MAMQNGTLCTALVLSLTVLTSQDCRSQDKPARFVLEAGEHHLGDIIESAARFLGRNYLISKADMGPNVQPMTLQKTLSLDAAGCEEVVSQLAYTKDFAMTPLDIKRGIYEFVYMRGAHRPEISGRAIHLTIEQILSRPRLKMMATTAVPLKHIDAARAGQQLRPFFANAGAGGAGLNFGTPGNQKALLLSGFIDNLAEAIRMIQEVDKPEPPRADRYVLRLAKRVEAAEKRIAELEKKLAIRKK